MKKILLSFVMFFALLMVTNAQILLNEGFENGVPSTWTTIDNDGDGYGWADADLTGRSGACVSSASYINNVGALIPDNWLITPQINLTGNAILTFFVAAQDESYCAEHYAVLISTTGNAVADFTTTLLEETYTAPSATHRTQAPYVEKTIDLSAYNGQQVYIAFRHYNVTDQFYLNLDDVKIMVIPTTPTIIAADASHDFGLVTAGNTATWSTTLQNYHLTEAVTASVASPFTVSANGSTYGQTATIPAAGGTLYVKFAPTSHGEYMGNIQLTSAGAPAVSIAVEGDGLDCDSLTLPYLSLFNDEGMYCWQIVDANNDGVTFFYNDEDEFAYYVTLEEIENSADDYMISPQFDFNGGVYLALDYFAPYSISYGLAEKFQVLAFGTDTIELTDVITVENEETETLLVDLDNLNGRYSIAMHCTSDASQYVLVFQNFAICEYEEGRVVADLDSLDYGVVVLGQDKVLPVKMTNLGVTADVTYSATAPFQVSLDNVNFSSQVVRTAPASNVEYDTLYVKLAPTAEGVFADFVTVTYLSNVDTIYVNGEAVDCSEGIAEFPFVYDFNTGLYPPVCWTVNNVANFSVVGIDEEGNNGIAYLALDRLVTPEIHSTSPLLLQFSYASYAGTQAVTSFVVGYSMNTVAEEDFVWSQPVVADNTEFNTHSAIIPANAKYAAIKVTELNEFTYWFWTYPNYLFIDNFVLTEITEPMLLLSSANVDFGGVALGQSSVKAVALSAALYTSPFAVASNQAEFTISTDEVTYGASATLPAEGGTLYIKYEPTTEGSHTSVVTMVSGTDTAEVAVQGRGYDCDAVITLPYYEGFEVFVDGNIPCWDNIDADGDGYFWKLANDAEVAHTGSRYVYSESYDNLVLTPNNFFISPMIAIPEGGATLGWFVTAADDDYAAEKYAVLVYVEGQEESYEVVFSETLSYYGWAWREVELLDYAGTNIRFAFRHYDCTNQYFMAIDDIQVTAGVGVESHESHEVTFGVYPNPANNMININASENMQKIQILNMAGQCVYSSQVGGNNTQVNVSNMADGMYFVKIYTDNGNVSTQKIVVRK